MKNFFLFYFSLLKGPTKKAHESRQAHIHFLFKTKTFFFQNKKRTQWRIYLKTHRQGFLTHRQEGIETDIFSRKRGLFYKVKKTTNTWALYYQSGMSHTTIFTFVYQLENLCHEPVLCHDLHDHASYDDLG